MQFLCNINNLNAPLRKTLKQDANGKTVEKEVYFRSRVEDILHFFEIIIDYKAEKDDCEGYWVSPSKFTPGKAIVGYDFCDIAKRVHRIKPRLHHLHSHINGNGWEKFAQSIKATTIFANGFGELLKAKDTCYLCPEWKLVPTGYDYLTASIAMLKRLRIVRDETTLDPGELAQNVVWASRCKLFERCACLDGQADFPHQHTNPVQLLLDKQSWMFRFLPKGSTKINVRDLDDGGAVIFGHQSWYRRMDGKQADEEDESTASSRVLTPSLEGDGLSTTPTTSQSTEFTIPSSDASRRDIITGSHTSGKEGKKLWPLPGRRRKK
jgi:hypothetical protein